jgi:hypothetical protein
MFLPKSVRIDTIRRSTFQFISIVAADPLFLHKQRPCFTWIEHRNDSVAPHAEFFSHHISKGFGLQGLWKPFNPDSLSSRISDEISFFNLLPEVGKRDNAISLRLRREQGV